MGQVVAYHLFAGVAIGADGMTISHLQYAEDTFLTGEASVDNLWVMKTVLRTFEMASRLRVSISKSSLIGV